MKQILFTLVLSLLGYIANPAVADNLPAFDKTTTAVLITDPQNEFLHPEGKLFNLLADNMKELNTIKAAPHKMYGPESNDLIYQLRNHGIETVILGGLVANLCVDSHMRSLMENGFRVYVVKDAVAAPGEDAYKAALTNYGMIANGVLTTREAVKAIGG